MTKTTHQQSARRQPISPARELSEKVRQVEAMSVRELRTAWQETFRQSPRPGLTKEMLARILTQRMQEKVFGGLNRETKAHLAKLANGNTESVGPLKSGSLIVREYEGVLHQVVIVPDGYLWKGKTYSSLSAIALKITGTTWNGPRFFGLRGSGSVDSGVDPQNEHHLTMEAVL